MIIHAWKNLLLSYPGVLSENITGILTYGCQLGYVGPDQFLLSTNLNSAKLAPELKYPATTSRLTTSPRKPRAPYLSIYIFTTRPSS